MDTESVGAKTARQFGYFNYWQGDVIAALNWIRINKNKNNIESVRTKFSSVTVRQIKPRELNSLPVPIKAKYSFGCRLMCQPANERTLIGTILPRGISGINAVRVIYFIDNEKLLAFSVIAFSVIGDFFIKVKGKSNVQSDDIGQLPLLDGGAVELAKLRVMRLVSLTEAYSELWKDFLDKRKSQENFDYRFKQEIALFSTKWSRNIAYRIDLERRQALVEIDVLVAIALTLTIDELIQVYSVQFSVMKTYEETDQYDTKGQRLPNTTRKDAGAKELREALKNHDGVSPVTASWPIDNGNQTVTKTFYPPFNHVDRIADYKTAYRVFSKRLGLNSNETGNAAS